MTRLAEKPGAEVVHFRMTSALDTVTRAVVADEPCYVLAELNLPSRSGKSKSRFQVLRVVRNDRLVTAYVYMGPASQFKADQVMIPGGQVENGKGIAWHTVAELQEIADELRVKPPYREIEPSDLQAAFQNMVEEKKRSRRKHSSFGPAGQLVRS
jgi:D-arabinose 1-dehydrogenase-like Zn-dependent alcohol dehydrogenase